MFIIRPIAGFASLHFPAGTFDTCSIPVILASCLILAGSEPYNFALRILAKIQQWIVN